MNGRMTKALHKELLRKDPNSLMELKRHIGTKKSVLFKTENYFKHLKKLYTRGKIEIIKTRKDMLSGL